MDDAGDRAARRDGSAPRDGSAAGNGPRPRPSRRRVDALLQEIGRWLDRPDPSVLIATTAGWQPSAHAAARGVIHAHGLAGWLATHPALTPALGELPGDLGAWLAHERDANALRIGRLHDDLGAALRALGRAGIEVMPLKGALLTTRPGAVAGRRPMADLDLLVRPADLEGARAALSALGYRRRDEPTRRPTHDTFERPGALAVISHAGEHPGNPAPIELHTEVKRHLWAWADDDDLTPLLWSAATPGRVLGEPAMIPSGAALLAHLAIHATSDLLLRRGRLSQWLDVAEAAGAATAADPDAVARLVHPRLAFPSLALAARRLPAAMRNVPLDGLVGRVPASLGRWTATVPLDSHAGLQARSGAPAGASTVAARWARWAPEPWRLTVAYGDRSRPMALAAHLARVAALATARRR